MIEMKPQSSIQFFVSLILLFMILALCQTLTAQLAPTDSRAKVASTRSESTIDPDIVDSESNHHLAGYILIGSAVLVLLSLYFRRAAFLRAIWPLLFVGAGLYLLAWSDKEIWPRGFLSWTWLIHHDLEALQHKIYGVLLLVMGAVEYLRWRGKMSGSWQTLSFPILAVVGACLLLVHDHGGNSGLPPGWDNSEKAARIAQMARASGRNAVSLSLTRQPSEPAMNMPAHQHDMAHMTSLPVNAEGKTSSERDASSHSNNLHSGHLMTASMLHVTTQHLWFTLVGLAIALFKFIDDASFWRKSLVAYLWPSGMLILGSLLVLYTETV